MTGVRAIRNGSTCTTCRGRSLSYEKRPWPAPSSISPPATGTNSRPLWAPGRSAGARFLAERRVEPVEVRERERLQHRLDVLLLVLQDQLVEHGVDAVPGSRGEHALADGGEVVARTGGVEQLDLAADRSRRLKGVVCCREVLAQQRLATVPVREPQILVGGDVGEVPGERAHQRVELALEVGVADRRGERERALASHLEGFKQRVAQVRCRWCTGHHSETVFPSHPDVTQPLPPA